MVDASNRMSTFHTCSIVLSLILSHCTVETVAHASNPIPRCWEKMCTLSDGANILGQYVDGIRGDVYYLHCQVRNHEGIAWHYSTLRDWLHDIPGISVFARVECTNGSSISLPWPMRARGVVGLSIHNCILRDKYLEFQNQTISDIPDQLRVLEIRDSVWFSDDESFNKMTKPASLANLTADYDCGQDSTLEYMVASNVSYGMDSVSAPNDQGLQGSAAVDFDLDAMLAKSKPSPDSGNSLENSVLLEALSGGGDKLSTYGSERYVSPPVTRTPENLTEEFLELVKKLEGLDFKCNYLKLRVIDESYPKIMIANHFKFMLQNAKYPELRVMNYTRSGLGALPRELKEHRIHFPKLEYLDLSENKIKSIDLGAQTATSGHVIVDLSHNLIANVSLEDVVAWSRVEDVFVDIRNNPIHCSCDMKPLLDYVGANGFFAGALAPYAYIRDLECATPDVLRGRKLSTLNLDCWEHARTRGPEVSGWASASTWAIAGCCAFGVVSTVAVVAVVLKLRTG
ncbi:unnamed protein product [Lymnaea stagnalis]|uniref:LRRCT domain-containing protein n=1 Tax=Lymnaea stagnalis TaxID=6523 RepID=A0AAV2HMJ4_LYMST